MVFPDRISELIKQVEAGVPLTQGDLRRLATLQALDLCRIGEDFVRDAVQRERDRTEEARKVMELMCQT